MSDALDAATAAEERQKILSFIGEYAGFLTKTMAETVQETPLTFSDVVAAACMAISAFGKVAVAMGARDSEGQPFTDASVKKVVDDLMATTRLMTVHAIKVDSAAEVDMMVNNIKNGFH